jgi:hypothetical protein
MDYHLRPGQHLPDPMIVHNLRHSLIFLHDEMIQDFLVAQRYVLLSFRLVPVSRSVRQLLESRKRLHSDLGGLPFNRIPFSVLQFS